MPSMTIPLKLLLLIAAATTHAAGASDWKYEKFVDKAGGGNTVTATATSTNVLRFPEPYAGGATGVLVVQQLPNGAREAALEVSTGRFLCPESGCRVSVTFDAGEKLSFEGRPPRSGRPDTVVFKDYAFVVGRMRKAKRLAVEAPFEEVGFRTLVFDVSTLQWPDEIVDKAVAASEAIVENPNGDGFVIQTRAYSERESARDFAGKLTLSGYRAHVVSRPAPKGAEWIVRVGAFPTRDLANAERAKLMRDGYAGFVVAARLIPSASDGCDVSAAGPRRTQLLPMFWLRNVTRDSGPERSRNLAEAQSFI